jgi:hypothetical protein
VVQTGQNSRPVSGDIEREKPQMIAEFPLRNSLPKQIPVFLSHKSA